MTWWLCKSNNSEALLGVLEVSNLLTICTLPRDVTCGCAKVTNTKHYFFVTLPRVEIFPRITQQARTMSGQKTYPQFFGNVIFALPLWVPLQKFVHFCLLFAYFLLRGILTLLTDH